MSVRSTGAPKTSDRAIQPQTTPPSPRRSKRTTLKVVFFTSIILSFCGTPWEPTSAQLPGGARVCRPETMVKDIAGYHIFALVHETRTTPPHVNQLGSLHGLPHPRLRRHVVHDVSMGRVDPGSSIAPTNLSGVLTDPLQPPERLHRLSRAASAEVAAP